jgi:hypothetical protein
MAFTGIDFGPCHASSFLLGYGQHVLLEKMKPETCFERLLPVAYPLTRQTDLIYVRTDKEKDIIGSRYLWVHEEVKPWGQDLPVQCSRCGRVRNWLFSKSKGNCIFSCKDPKCEEKLVFSPPEKMAWVGIGISGGRWLSKDLYITD